MSDTTYLFEEGKMQEGNFAYDVSADPNVYGAELYVPKWELTHLADYAFKANVDDGQWCMQCTSPMLCQVIMSSNGYVSIINEDGDLFLCDEDNIRPIHKKNWIDKIYEKYRRKGE